MHFHPSTLHSIPHPLCAPLSPFPYKLSAKQVVLSDSLPELSVAPCLARCFRVVPSYTSQGYQLKAPCRLRLSSGCRDSLSQSSDPSSRAPGLGKWELQGEEWLWEASWRCWESYGRGWEPSGIVVRCGCQEECSLPPSIKVPRYSVSPSIKLILWRCDLRQECRSVQTTRANMFFRFGFYGRIKVYFP